MARGDCNITNICIPTRRILYAGGFTPPAPPPPPECNFPEGSFSQGGEICDWGYRVRWDIDNAQVPSDQINYLAYISLEELVNDLSPGDNAIFWNDANRAEFRVTSSDGITEIPHYTSAIDNINETGYIWALVPVASTSVTTSLFIYFANPAATEYAVGDPLGRNATFTGFAAVHDTAQDPSGAAPQLTDLTGNANNHTTKGSMTTSDLVAGKVGKAWAFDGTNDAATKSDPTFKADMQGTISLWVKVNSIFGVDGVRNHYSVGGAAQGTFAIWAVGKRRVAGAGTSTYWSITKRRAGSLVAGFSATTTPLAAATTYQFVITSGGATWQMKINNVAQTLTSWSSQGNNGDWFGDMGYAGTPVSSIANGYYNGGSGAEWSDDDIGPVMVRSSVPSDDRLTTEYNNQNAPGTFATFTNFLANT